MTSPQVLRTLASSAALAIMLLAPPRAWPATPDPVATVTFSGTARTEVVPDLATITAGVTGEAPTATAAATANARKALALYEAAKALGVAEADVTTVSVALARTYDETKDDRGNVGQKPRGFASENVLAIRVRDLSRVGEIAEALVQRGANRFDGITFSVEHPEPILAKLAGDAVKDAKAQAELAAKAAGARLGRVLSIERIGGGESTPYAFPMSMKLAATPAIPVAAGTASLSQTVRATWALAPN